MRIIIIGAVAAGTSAAAKARRNDETAEIVLYDKDSEYSCAVKPQFREIGNRLTGTLETTWCEFTRSCFYLIHRPASLRYLLKGQCSGC